MIIKRIIPSTQDVSQSVIFLGGRRHIFLDSEICLRYQLKEGDEIPEELLSGFLKSSDKAKAKSSAARICGRREVSKKELHDKLARRGFEEGDIESAVDWLSDVGALSDEEYAGRIVSHYKKKGYGKLRISEILHQKGLRYDLDDFDNSQAIRDYLEKKLSDGTDVKQKKKVIEALYRRGFTYSEILGELHEEI